MENLATAGHNYPPTEEEVLQQKLDESESKMREALPSVPSELDGGIADDKKAGEVTEYVKNLKSIQKRISASHKALKQPYLDAGRKVDGWKKKLDIELSGSIDEVTPHLTTFLNAKAAEERARQLELAEQARIAAEALAKEAEAHSNAGINDTADSLLNAAVEAEVVADRIENGAITSKPSDLVRTRSNYGSTASQKLTWAGDIESVPAINLETLRGYFSEDSLQKAVNAFIKDGGRELAGVKIYQKSTLNIR